MEAFRLPRNLYARAYFFKKANLLSSRQEGPASPAPINSNSTFWGKGEPHSKAQNFVQRHGSGGWSFLRRNRGFTSCLDTGDHPSSCHKNQTTSLKREGASWPRCNLVILSHLPAGSGKGIRLSILWRENAGPSLLFAKPAPEFRLRLFPSFLAKDVVWRNDTD